MTRGGTIARLVGHTDGAGCWCVLCRNPNPEGRTKRQERRRLKRRERQAWRASQAHETEET